MVHGKYLSTLIVCLLLCLINAADANASRYVKVEVLLDGKVILRGSASDNGRRDADELWEALKKVDLKPTAEFQKLAVQAAAKEYLIKSMAADGKVKIAMYFGGVAETVELKIYRVPIDKFGREWRLAAEDINRLAKDRVISPEEVAKVAKRQEKK